MIRLPAFVLQVYVSGRLSLAAAGQSTYLVAEIRAGLVQPLYRRSGSSHLSLTRTRLLLIGIAVDVLLSCFSPSGSSKVEAR